MQTCLEHKHDMSGNYHGWAYQVCALTMFAISQNFRVIILEHKLDMSIKWQLFSKTTLYTVRLQLYKSCTMMFALVSMIYPRITMVGQNSDIREHLQTLNVDYLGTSKIDIIPFI